MLKQQSRVFESLLTVRKFMYLLMDQGVFKEDEITAFEEETLSRLGIEYQDYLDWKDD